MDARRQPLRVRDGRVVGVRSLTPNVRPHASFGNSAGRPAATSLLSRIFPATLFLTNANGLSFS